MNLFYNDNYSNINYYFTNAYILIEKLQNILNSCPLPPTVQPECKKLDTVTVKRQDNQSTVPSTLEIKSKILYNSEQEKQYIFRTFQVKKNINDIQRPMRKMKTRLFDMDSLLKKIKAKYLKYVYKTLSELLRSLNLNIRYFDQKGIVRNIDIDYNRGHFLDLTINEFLEEANTFSQSDFEILRKQTNPELQTLLNTKIKYHYQFNFLRSKFFKDWLKDPNKFYTQKSKECSRVGLRALKYKNFSQNLFNKNDSIYKTYISELFDLSFKFIFYFQNK